MSMATAKDPIQQRRRIVKRKGLGEFLPTSVQKSYFLLSASARDVLNSALEKYRPGQSEPILVGGDQLLKPALQLMTFLSPGDRGDQGYRSDNELHAVGGSRASEGAENQEVYLTFSPRFERIWLESKKRLMEYVAQKQGDIGLRSQYALRLYSWVQKYVKVGTKRVSLEQLRKVLGLESVQDADGKVIQEAPLPVWANFRQRALDTAIAEINKKTDLNIVLESLERSAHRQVTTLTFAIKTQAVPNGDSKGEVPVK
jgi:Initiator Replication protein